MAVPSRGCRLFPQGAATECASSQALPHRTFSGAPPAAHPAHLRARTFRLTAGHPRPHTVPSISGLAPSGTSEIATPPKPALVKCIRWDEKCVWGTYPRRTLAPNIYIWRTRHYGCRCQLWSPGPRRYGCRYRLRLPRTHKVACVSLRIRQP